MSPSRTGLPNGKEINKIDSLIMHSILLSAINCTFIFNENSIKSKDIHVATEKKHVLS
jgi:hypothetical protein